jgi:hypothetical protein
VREHDFWVNILSNDYVGSSMKMREQRNYAHSERRIRLGNVDVWRAAKEQDWHRCDVKPQLT